MSQEKVVVIPNAKVKVVSAVSSKGNPYKCFVVDINGKSFRVGFVSAQNELDLLRAGIDIDK